MQEVAVVLWERFDTYDETRSFRAWAFGVARYQALMFLRRARSDRHVFDDTLAQRVADAAVEHAQHHDAQREALDACLRRLDPGQRDLILEAYAPGIRIDHLAQKRGQTAMALYKTLHRIRMLLIACIRGHYTRGAVYE
jgi:RNA polymerase sigma-70 factor (ECF subfamily)